MACQLAITNTMFKQLIGCIIRLLVLCLWTRVRCEESPHGELDQTMSETVGNT